MCCCHNCKLCNAMLWHDNWDLEGSWSISLLHLGKGQGPPGCLWQQQVVTLIREVSFHLPQQSGYFLWSKTKIISGMREEGKLEFEENLPNASALLAFFVGPDSPTRLCEGALILRRWDKSQIQWKALWSDEFETEIMVSPSHSLDPTGHSLLFRHQSPWSTDKGNSNWWRDKLSYQCTNEVGGGNHKKIHKEGFPRQNQSIQTSFGSWR